MSEEKKVCPDCHCPESHHLAGLGCTTITGWEETPGGSAEPLTEATMAGQSWLAFDTPSVLGVPKRTPILCPCERGVA
jgi:hypothetical protein